MDDVLTDSAAALSALGGFLADRRAWSASIQGTDAVFRLEQRFAALTGHRHALAVSNATLGLWSVFRALGLRGSDVMTSPYTWGGTIAGLLATRNQPVFADVDRRTPVLDPVELEQSITRRTEAILAPDIYGHPANGPAFKRIAARHGLVLIQDCAQGFGAYYRGRHTGAFADVAVFSLTFGKALFAGEGGVIVTSDEQLFRRLVSLTQHPARQARDLPFYPISDTGLNLRINPLAAVVADALFERVLGHVAERRLAWVEKLNWLHAQGLSKTTAVPTSEALPSFEVATFEPRGNRRWSK